jgi:hypothetical protein
MTAHTEEVLVEQKRVEAETDKFLADPRTIRFETTDYNFTCLSEFLDQHGLEVNHRNLLFAYDSLQDTLELIPFQQPIPASEPVTQPAAPQPPSALPAAPSANYRNGQPIEIGRARRL